MRVDTDALVSRTSEINERVARSLADLHRRTRGGTKTVFRSGDFGRPDREVLIAAGHLKTIIRGWLMLSSPGEAFDAAGSWQNAHKEFCRAYLDDRFGPSWVLSPETSILSISDKLGQSMRIVVRAKDANNDVIRLPHGASIFACRAPKPVFVAAEKEGLRIYPPNEALCSISPKFWIQNPTEVRFVLNLIRDPVEILGPLLRDGKVLAAGRLASAFRSIGRADCADEILLSMRKAGYDVREIRS